MDLLFWSGIGFICAVVFASFSEWVLHRYVMHRTIGKFDSAFTAHAVVHHQIFKADHTYHLIKEEDKRTIPMAWWNGPVLVLLCQIPFLIWSIFSGHWGLVIGSFISCSAYYGAYEYMHWCMHLPK